VTEPFNLILLPGLGADSRLFAPQAAEFEQLQVPDWIEPKRRERLVDYAERLAATVTPRADIPLILGGVSLGGMIAYEMARHVKPDVLILIATCRTRAGLDRYRLLAPPARRLPAALVGLTKWPAPAVVRMFMPWPKETRRLGVSMYRATDSRFMSWALGALLDWDPSPAPDIPIRQIHGGRDRAIPAARVQADQVIPGGGHLINLLHADEVNAFIRSAAQDCLGR
jgi:pimeloyl-ACP methyl ester carboxylesterase